MEKIKYGFLPAVKDRGVFEVKFQASADGEPIEILLNLTDTNADDFSKVSVSIIDPQSNHSEKSLLEFEDVNDFQDFVDMLNGIVDLCYSYIEFPTK